MDVPGIGRRFKKGIRGAGLGFPPTEYAIRVGVQSFGRYLKEVGLRLASAGAIRKPTPLG